MDNKEAAVEVKKAVYLAIRRLMEPGKGARAGGLTSGGTAMLAKLRRAAGKSVEQCPEVWEITISALAEDHLQGQSNYMERARAAFTALSLFGMHQQGKSESISGKNPFGMAVRAIVAPDKSNEDGIRRRFNALCTAVSFDELVVHTRALVQLMKQKDVTLDYPDFAEDLFWYQVSEQSRNNTRMRWGRHFYRMNKPDDNNNNQEGNDNE